MRTVTRRVTAEDGTPIGYQATGEGPALLLVHGAAADARQWSRLVPLLAPRFTVMAMDRRGRGMSGPLRPDHSLEVEYGDIATVANSVHAPVHLLGHSSGARFALHAALRTSNLASLVLYEPPPPETFDPGVLESLATLAASGDREGILRTFLVDVADNSEDALAWIRTRPIWPIMLDNALTLPAELRAAREYRFDPSAFADFTVPTLCLLGELSGGELRRAVHRTAEALGRAHVATLRGQGHGAMFSAPELLATQVEGFLATVDVEAASSEPPVAQSFDTPA